MDHIFTLNRCCRRNFSCTKHINRIETYFYLKWISVRFAFQNELGQWFHDQQCNQANNSLTNCLIFKFFVITIPSIFRYLIVLLWTKIRKSHFLSSRWGLVLSITTIYYLIMGENIIFEIICSMCANVNIWMIAPSNPHAVEL